MSEMTIEEELAERKRQWEKRQAEKRRVAVLDAEIEKLTKALEKIKSETCPMGTDWGNSDVYKLASDALVKVD